MSYSLPWNKAVWTEQSDCRTSWGDGNRDTAVPAWSRDTMGPGGIFFPVIFPCAVALLFLRNTSNHWLAVSGVMQKKEKPARASPLCHQKYHVVPRYPAATMDLFWKAVTHSFPMTGLWFLLLPWERIRSHAMENVIGLLIWWIADGS